MENTIQSTLDCTRGGGKEQKLNCYKRLHGEVSHKSVLKAGVNRRTKKRASEGSDSDSTGKEVMGPGVF